MTVVDVAEQLQELAKRDLQSVPREEAAERLGVYPPVVDRYIRERVWPVERSLEVLQAYGRDVRFQVVQ